MRKALFLFANSLIVLGGSLVAGSLTVFVFKVLLNELKVCSWIGACVAEENFINMGATNFTGFLVPFFAGAYLVALIVYWSISSGEFLGTLPTKLKTNVLCFAIFGSATLPFIFWMWSDSFSIAMLQISFLIGGLLMCQIQRPLLMWLKKEMLRAERNGEKLCLN